MLYSNTTHSNLTKLTRATEPFYVATGSFAEWDVLQRIVEFSIRKHCSSALADKAINGYRRSNSSADALLEDWLKCDIPFHKVPKDEHYLLAIDVTKQLFQPSRILRPVSFPDLRYYPWKLSVNAEAPYNYDPSWTDYLKQKHSLGLITSSRPTFHNLYNEIFNYERSQVHRIKEGLHVPLEWNTAHARSHLVKSDEPDKIRMVHGVPKRLLFVENMFMWPLLRDYIERESPMLWGYETLLGGWYKLYNLVANKKKRFSTFLSIDWSQFDKRAQYEVIDDVHLIWRTFFTFDLGYEPTRFYPSTRTDPKRIQRLWDWMTNAVKFTPIRTPDGDLWQRNFATIASGFMQTQLLDSFVNSIMILTCLSSLGINISSPDFLLKVQGDDSFTALLEYIPPLQHSSFLNDLSQFALYYFNAVLSVNKSEIRNTMHGLKLLGFSNKYSSPYKDEAELLAHLFYPERRSTHDKLMATSLGIAMASCGNSKCVYDVCKDIFNYLSSKGNTINLAGLPDIIKNLDVAPTADRKSVV